MPPGPWRPAGLVQEAGAGARAAGEAELSAGSNIVLELVVIPLICLVILLCLYSIYTALEGQQQDLDPFLTKENLAQEPVRTKSGEEVTSPVEALNAIKTGEDNPWSTPPESPTRQRTPEDEEALARLERELSEQRRQIAALEGTLAAGADPLEGHSAAAADEERLAEERFEAAASATEAIKLEDRFAAAVASARGLVFDDQVAQELFALQQQASRRPAEDKATAMAEYIALVERLSQTPEQDVIDI